MNDRHTPLWILALFTLAAIVLPYITGGVTP